MVDEDFHKRAGVGSVVRCDCGEPGCPHEVPAPAPFVKVTTLDGRVREAAYSDGSPHLLDGPDGYVDFWTLAPKEALPPGVEYEGPKGTFEVTVKFTPAGPEAGK